MSYEDAVQDEAQRAAGRTRNAAGLIEEAIDQLRDEDRDWPGDRRMERTRQAAERRLIEAAAHLADLAAQQYHAWGHGGAKP